IAAVAAPAGQRLHLDALERLDRLLRRGPLAAGRLAGLLDRRLVGHDREVGVVRLVVRPLLEALLVPLGELAQQRARVRRLEVQRVVAHDRALGCEGLLHRLVDAAGGREHELRALGQAGGVGLLHQDRRVARPERGEDEVGLGLLERGDVGGEVGLAELGPELDHGRGVHAELLHDGEKGRPVVAAVRVVVVDAGDRLDLALELPGREDRRHHRLGLVVDAAEGVARLRDRFLHALLRRRVPGEPERLELLAHRADGQPDRRRDAAGDDLGLRLQRELAEALDGVLGIRLFLDHQLDLPPGDAAGGVDAIDGELRAAQPRLADGSRDTGLRRQDANADGRRLREGRRNVEASARGLGLHLAEIALPPRLHLFIGHPHWDHIQGFPFFVPAFMPGAELNIYAPLGFQRGLEEAMAGQMEYSYFPVKLRDLRSRIHFTELDEGFFRVGDMLVETQYLNHTAPTIAYRISSGGACVAYAPH